MNPEIRTLSVGALTRVEGEGALHVTLSYFFSGRGRHTRSKRDWSSDVCSSDLWNRWIAESRSSRVRIFRTNSDTGTARFCNPSIPPLGILLFLAKCRMFRRREMLRCELDVRHYFPGGRNLTVLSVAWSTSSGVISTVIRDFTAPLALAASDRADASTLLGRSTMITKSSLPKA